MEVEVRETATELEVRVTDDGAGGARVRAAGGLAGLKDRVESLGGWFEVGPGPRGGAAVTACFTREPPS